MLFLNTIQYKCDDKPEQTKVIRFYKTFLKIQCVIFISYKEVRRRRRSEYVLQRALLCSKLNTEHRCASRRYSGLFYNTTAPD